VNWVWPLPGIDLLRLKRYTVLDEANAVLQQLLGFLAFLKKVSAKLNISTDFETNKRM
jgi:hypothetical protein